MEPIILNIDDEAAQAVIVPAGSTANVFRPEQPYNEVRQSFCAEDLPSLQAYLAREVVTPITLAIYVDTNARKVTAILDHAASAEQSNCNLNTATLQLEFSPEFAPLHAVLGKDLTQEQFLELIEDQSHLFLEAAKLQDMVAMFQSTQVVRFKQFKNLSNGTGSLSFDTSESADETTKLPTEITTILPIYRFQGDVTLKLKLRYAIKQGAIAFKIICPGLDKIVRDEVVKVENGIQVWISEMDRKTKTEIESKTKGLDSIPVDTWSRVLLVRGSVEVTKPKAASTTTINGGTLPPGLTALTAGVPTSGTSSRY